MTSRTGIGPVVLLPGTSDWDPVAEVLVAGGYCCVTHDSPTAGDVAALILAEPGPPTVVGTSLATLRALGEPGVADHVASVVLVDAVADPHLTGLLTLVVPGPGHRDAPAELARSLLDHVGSPPVRRRRIDRLLDTSAVHGIPHPGGMLREHLDRTADRLADWGAPAWVQDAGRLHAAFGTEGFPDGIPGLTTAAILAVAGTEAATLVDHYGRCDRARSYPTLTTPTPTVFDRHTGAAHALAPDHARAFAELTAANELDVVGHSPAIAEEHGPALVRLFDRLAPLLSPAARAAWAATPLGRTSR